MHPFLKTLSWFCSLAQRSWVQLSHAIRRTGKADFTKKQAALGFLTILVILSTACYLSMLNRKNTMANLINGKYINQRLIDHKPKESQDLV